MYLLVDNSNTRTKFMLSRDGVSGEVRVLPTADLTLASVQELLQGWKFCKTILSSVVPAAAEVLKTALSAYPLQMLSAGNAKGVDFSTYAGISTLGADRVANVLAAVQCVDLPLVAVDAGTATTFDVVVQGEILPCFAGGLIAPGFASVASCLHKRTALLPPVDVPSAGVVIGQNTSEAMAAAIRIGYPGMVEAILNAIELELGEPVNVVLTGGDAKMLAAAMQRVCKVEPLLTMQGIALGADTCV